MRPANERWRYTVTSSLIGWRIHEMIPADMSLVPNMGQNFEDENE